MTGCVWSSQCSVQGKESTHTVNSISNERNFCFLLSLRKKFSEGWQFDHTSKDQILMEIIKALSYAVKQTLLLNVKFQYLIWNLEDLDMQPFIRLSSTQVNSCILRNAETVWNKAEEEETKPKIDVWSKKIMDHSTQICQNYQKL